MRSLLLRGSLGSLIIALAALGYMPIPRPTRLDHEGVIGLVRYAPWGREACLIASFVGLSLLTWAWWSLRGQIVGRGDGVLLVRLAALVWSVPMLAAPPVFSGDGWSYVATGYLAGHRLSPYVWTSSILPFTLQSAVSHRWLHTVSPYGPVPLAWGGVASRLTSQPWLLLYSYRLLAVVALLLVAWAVPRVARRAGQDPVRATWLVVASPFVLTQGIGGLHNDLLAGGLVLTAVAVTSRGRWFWGAVLVGLAAAVKIPGAIGAVAVVLLAAPYGSALILRLRLAVCVGGVASAVLVGVGLLANVGVGWIQGLAVPAHQRTILAVPYLAASTLRRLTPVLGAQPAVSWLRMAQLSSLVALLGLCLYLLLRPARLREPAMLATCAGLLLAGIILSPVSQYWYLMWALPLLGCVRLPREQSLALVGVVTVWGMVGFADAALHVPWLLHWATAAAVFAPALVWLVARLVAGAGSAGSGISDRRPDQQPGLRP